MSTLESPQSEREATKAGRPALAPRDLSEERTPRALAAMTKTETKLFFREPLLRQPRPRPRQQPVRRRRRQKNRSRRRPLGR